MRSDLNSAFGTYNSVKNWRQRFTSLSRNRKIPGVIRKYLKSYPRELICDISIDGLKFRCYPGQNNHDRKVFEKSILLHEKHKIEFLASEHGETYIDIGANSGTIVVPWSFMVPKSSRIIAFEPNPISYNRLLYNLNLNHIQNVEAFNYALGKDEKNVYLVLSGRNLGQCTIADNNRSKSTEVTVPQKKLSNVLLQYNNPKIEAIKIDVEGYEDRILMPYFKCYERKHWPKRLVVEHTSSKNWDVDCIGWMKQNGYNVKYMSDQDTYLAL
jgi:FkbM family methyltransferase